MLPIIHMHGNIEMTIWGYCYASYGKVFDQVTLREVSWKMIKGVREDENKDAYSYFTRQSGSLSVCIWEPSISHMMPLISNTFLISPHHVLGELLTFV